MRLTRRTLLAAGGASIAAAGCVGADETDNQSGDQGDDSTAIEESQDVTVQVRSHADFGDILVDEDGLIFYNFDADTQGESASECYEDCTDAGTPLTVDGIPAAGDDVMAELTTFQRDDGAMQVTANGWPLYYFQDDDDPGDAEGQGVNDEWWVLRPDGTPIRGDEGASPSGESADVENADATVAVGADGDLRFEPERLAVRVGDTVAFVWEANGHNIAVREQPPTASWEGGLELRDEGYAHQHTFEMAGVYEYFCEPHKIAGMTGEIHVTDGEGSTEE